MLNTLLPAPRAASFLVLFGMFFNALLAFVNAQGIGVSASHVMLMEGLIMGSIVLLCTPQREAGMKLWALFSFAFLILFLWIAMVNAFLGQSVSPKALRDVFLISFFGILGMAYHKQGGNPVPLFRVAALAVVAVMLFENYATELYGRVFDVAKYYANTRGITDTTDFGKEQLGLFINTQLVQGRFTLGFLTSHRLGSLFLEQTSLANFAIIMAMATSVFWARLTRADKLIFTGCTVVCIMGTDSRMALGLCAMFAVGFFIFPRLPKVAPLLYMPGLLVLSWILFYDPHANTLLSDDLPGRFQWSLTQMSWIDFQGFMGGRPELIARSMDSGYAYMIYAQSIFGMGLFWLFTSLIVPVRDDASRRMANMIALFVAVNLMTGPTIFSIKTAAILWFLAGYVRRQVLEKNPSPSTKAAM